MKYVTIDPSAITIPELQGFLQAAVAPRPIAFASTVDQSGNVNLSPFSFFNVFSANPPILIFSPARRVRDNTSKHTLENILEVPEVVINIVNYSLVEQASLTSTEYDKGVNEFIKAGLTQLPSTNISPPRVAESPVSFECVVDNVIPLGDKGGAGSLVIARVVQLHIQEQYLEDGKLNTTKLDLVARMGGNWYCRASGSAVFEIPKPILTKGIGIDSLPESIRNSEVLSGNNLGRLGNTEKFPTETEIEEASRNPDIAAIIRNGQKDQQKRLHILAKIALENNQISLAFSILMIANRFKT
jgi:flavin reductase (DIM6/NTAB) family NADH-FMN oxidoreductase RutF